MPYVFQEPQVGEPLIVPGKDESRTGNPKLF